MNRTIVPLVLVLTALAVSCNGFAPLPQAAGGLEAPRAWYPHEASRSPWVPGVGVMPPSGAEPAPMGFADFGVGSSGTYSYSSSEFQAELNVTSLRVNNFSLGSSAAQLTAQLNVVLKFVDGGTTYVYWIQNVELIDTLTDQTEFNNNIWNFTGPGDQMFNSSVSGNGSVFSSPQGGFYVYQDAASFQTLSAPYYTYLDVFSFVTAAGTPAVEFGYQIGNGAFVPYDTVAFPFAQNLVSDSNFVVDGARATPVNTYFDAEFVLGGPGGGSQTSDVSSNATLRLYYWNGHSFQTPTNAYNVGGDTAEGIANVRATYSSDPSGALWSHMATGSGSPGRLYSRSQIGLLSVGQTGIASGWLLVDNASSWYFRDSANITIAPGTYVISMRNMSSGIVTSLGLCTLSAGGSLAITPSRPCPSLPTPTIASFAVSPGAVDVGRILTFAASAAGGTAPLTFAYSGLPPGCASANVSVLACRPTGSGAFAVTLTVTDAAGRSASARVNATVNAAPSAALAFRPSGIDVGHTTQLAVTVSGGTGPFSFSFGGLPHGCAGQSSSFSCSPSVSGTYSASVTVTDADGGRATASASLLVAVLPSVQSFSVAGAAAQGQRLTLVVTALGGVPPLSYAYAGLPPGCPSANTANLACVPADSGSYVVTVTVRDANGASATDTMSVNVSASPISVFGSGSLWLWIALAAIAVGIASAVVAVRSQRRTRVAPVAPGAATGRYGSPPAAPVSPGLSAPGGTGVERSAPVSENPPRVPTQCPRCGAYAPAGADSCPRCAAMLNP